MNIFTYISYYQVKISDDFFSCRSFFLSLQILQILQLKYS